VKKLSPPPITVTALEFAGHSAHASRHWVEVSISWCEAILVNY
jgi:hypothetical protein